jgi:hypothetical protein
MGTDYAEKEREFIDSLADDTGRDLDQWMQAISAAGHAQRNDIIDWLRQQGFAFPKASWLERIHHNSGCLIYGGNAAAMTHVLPAQTRRHAPEPRNETLSAAASASAAPNKKNADVAVSRATEPAERQTADPGYVPGSTPAEIAQFLGAAKGLKPLAEFVLREIEAAVPGISNLIAAPYLTIAAPAAFAALFPAPKELRLYADFGAASGERVRKADTTAGRGAPPFPNVLVLNDARQIDGTFRDLVAAAYTRALK